MNIGVHTSHCCAEHGCKYGNADCPVVLGTHEQEFPCEECLEERAEFDARAALLARYPSHFIAVMTQVLKTDNADELVKRAVQTALEVMSKG